MQNNANMHKHAHFATNQNYAPNTCKYAQICTAHIPPASTSPTSIILEVNQAPIQVCAQLRKMQTKERRKFGAVFLEKTRAARLMGETVPVCLLHGNEGLRRGKVTYKGRRTRKGEKGES